LTRRDFILGAASVALAPRPSRTVKIGVAQFDAVPERVAENLQTMARLTRQAAGEGARWVLFHESSAMDYTPRLGELAEAVPDGRSTRFMAAVARETGTFIGFGLSERAGDRFHIAHVFVGPQGYVHHYRKTWLWYLPDDRAGSWLGGFRDEWARYDPGTGPESFEIDGVRAACFICADGNSERCLDRISRLRAEVVFWPNNRSSLSEPEVYRTRARRFGAPLLVANRIGKSWVRETTGGALICAADGSILGQANREGREEVVVRELRIG
jgi:predicted amidohydrolase